ncbi:MAG TPA: hypothetical protein VG936_12285 [Lacunisphaera sp.]|nr:hypothetical protein [Lacunisphaera sp.]
MLAQTSEHERAGEFGWWALRGLLCAAPSAGWAVLAGFNRPADWAAMTLGTLGWIAGFGGLAVATQARVPGFMRSLKMSAWIKPAAIPLGLLGLPLVSGLKLAGVSWLALGLVPDLWAGIGSIGLVERLVGLAPELSLASHHAFGWTLLATLIQGAFVAAMVVAGAFVLVGGQRLWQAGRAAGLFPARLTG